MSWVRRHKVLTVVVALAVLGLWGSMTESAEQPGDTPGDTSEVVAAESLTSDDAADEPDEDVRSESEKKKRKKGSKKTHLVVHVIDGDTLDLANGRRVRLAGIDAPEVGQCGYKRARNTLRRLVEGRRVTLAASDEEQDQYGRLLKYVDVGTVDAGLRLIKKGLAIARYDSRDGYGYHPREPRYIAADQASPPYRCAPKPVPFAAAPKKDKPKGSCAPGYSPCIRPYPPDLDCPQIGRLVTVTGSDPHRLDRDGDGQACEWS